MPASAAAIAITKNTITSPFTIDRTLENAMNTKFTEFNISSTAIKIITALRLVRTPSTPMENKIPARER